MLLLFVLLMMMTVAAVMLVLLLFIMVMMAVMLMLHFFQIRGNGMHAVHRLEQLLAGQFRPGSGHQRGLAVMLTDQRHRSIQLLLGNRVGAGQDDGGCGLDLIVIELTKVLHIDLDLAGIRHRHRMAQSHLVIRDLLHGGDHIGQFAHAGGFDNDAVRGVVPDYLRQRLAEIAHKRAADAAGIHLGDFNTGILQEAAVNTDLAELILNEHQFFALVSFLDHLFDQGCLSGAQKAGVNIDFCHNIFAPSKQNISIYV